jgi:hypothetical protein
MKQPLNSRNEILFVVYQGSHQFHKDLVLISLEDQRIGQYQNLLFDQFLFHGGDEKLVSRKGEIQAMRKGRICNGMVPQE